MFNKFPRDFINALIVTIAVSLIVTIYVAFKDRYFTPKISFHYSILDAKWPRKDIAAPHLDSQVLRIFIRNNSNKDFRLSEINIGGVEKFYGLNSSIETEGNMTDTPDINHTINEPVGHLALSNIPLIETGDELGIYIWGKFYSTTYVEATSHEETYRAIEAVLVTGVELFFAAYWEAILILFITVFFFLYYFFSTRMNKGI